MREIQQLFFSDKELDQKVGRVFGVFTVFVVVDWMGYDFVFGFMSYGFPLAQLSPMAIACMIHSSVSHGFGVTRLCCRGLLWNSIGFHMHHV